MLARHPGLPVRSVVLLSPIVDPGQDEQASRAMRRAHADPVSGDALNALASMAGALTPFGESGAQELIDSVRSDGAAFAAAAARDGQRIRWLAVIPLADAVTLPVCDLPGNVIVVPALHGSLLGDPAIDRMAHRFLSNEQVARPAGHAGHRRGHRGRGGGLADAVAGPAATLQQLSPARSRRRVVLASPPVSCWPSARYRLASFYRRGDERIITDQEVIHEACPLAATHVGRANLTPGPPSGARAASGR